MKLFVFRCRARPKMYGATRFETASNLPTDRCSGGWEFCERLELGLRGTVRFAVDTNTLRREVQKNGWYVWDESPVSVRRETAVETKPARREEPLPPLELEIPAAEVPPARIANADPPVTPKVAPAPAARAVSEPRVEENTRSAAKPPTRHQVVWFDIPVRDIDRAMRFYSAVLGTPLRKEQAGPGAAVAVLPHAEGAIGGCLVWNIDAKPSESGPLIYLNTHGRLDLALNVVEKHGGTVLSTTHSIAPFGFRAIILDSEGNRIALHSM
jgi:uncharacterized protein